jgi:predicted 3-demethylubiquinone-9 3-methyltransferase (glyoxalase superfamily)
MQKITPFLWFDDQAEEAARFYTSIFKDSGIGVISRYGEGAPRPAGSVMVVPFRICGQDFLALNGGPHYKLNPAVSFVVSCETQDEIDDLWEKLSDGGQLMQCGWLTDRFGVTWQIVPAILGRLFQDNDPEKVRRVSQAMMQMVKLDIAGLQAAYEGK